MRFQNTAESHTLTQPRKHKDSQKVDVNQTENSDALKLQYLTISSTGKKINQKTHPSTPIVVHLQQGKAYSIPKFKSRKTKLKPNEIISRTNSEKEKGKPGFSLCLKPTIQSSTRKNLTGIQSATKHNNPKTIPKKKSKRTQVRERIPKHISRIETLIVSWR